MSKQHQPPDKQRRAHSVTKSRARIESGGDPEHAAALSSALSEPRTDSDLADSVTHPLHSYPARMHPATARRLVSTALPDAAGKTLLDPFCGSGTVLVEARYAGARAIGVDANPLAVAISRAKTWTVPRSRRLELRRAGDAVVKLALAEGKDARRSGYEPPPPFAPSGVNQEERDRKLGDWFAPHVRREVEFLAARVQEWIERDEELGRIMQVLLSSLLYKVSRRASDTDTSRVERRIGRGAAARLFGGRLDLLLAGLDDLATSSEAPVPQVELGDARDLQPSGGQDDSVDVIVTSPPYAGTYDYAEQHQLRLDFLGMSGDAFAAAEIGARRSYGSGSQSRRRARRAWERDLTAFLAEMKRVVRPGGSIALVVGDSVAGGRAVFANEMVRACMGDGLEIVAWARQARPVLGASEREAFADRPKREHVLLFVNR